MIRCPNASSYTQTLLTARRRGRKRRRGCTMTQKRKEMPELMVTRPSKWTLIDHVVNFFRGQSSCRCIVGRFGQQLVGWFMPHGCLWSCQLFSDLQLGFLSGLVRCFTFNPIFCHYRNKIIFFREFHFSFARQRSMKAAFLVFSLILSIRATRVVTRLSFRIVLAEPSTRT